MVNNDESRRAPENHGREGLLYSLTLSFPSLIDDRDEKAGGEEESRTRRSQEEGSRGGRKERNEEEREGRVEHLFLHIVLGL